MNKIPLPHNLNQGNLRIGIDALLLTAFVLRHKLNIKHFVELGIGNGLASCALGLNLPNAHGFGVDIVPEAVNTATENAIALGLQNRLNFHLADVGSKNKLRTLYHEHMGQNLADMLITNPPYHKHGTGRVSKDIDRRLALHQEEDTLKHFCAASRELLKHQGHFFCIYAPAHLPDLLQTLQGHGFGIRQILPMHTRPKRMAKWVLVHAQKDTCSDVELLPQINIYTDNDELTPEILEFCPWIG